MKHIYISLLLVHVSLSLLAQTNKKLRPILCNTKALLSANNNDYGYVAESPNSNYLCFSTGKLNDVFLYDLTKKTKPKLIYSSKGSGYFPSWKSDGSGILMRTKNIDGVAYKTGVVEYQLAKNKVIPRKDLYAFNYQSAATVVKKEDPVIYINDKLQLVKSLIYGQLTKIIEEKQNCYQALLSPNKQKIAVHIGSNIWIYDITGKNKPINLGIGLVTGWSPNSNYLIGFKDESNDGHNVDNSELFLINLITNERTQLTTTKDKIEMNPSWSYDGKSIYFIDATKGAILKGTIKNIN